MKIKYASSLIFAALFACAAHAAPKNLNGYDQLLQSLHQGNDVKAIIYFDQALSQDLRQKIPEQQAARIHA